MTTATDDAIHQYNSVCRKFSTLKQFKIAQGYTEESKQFEQSVTIELSSDHSMSGSTITLHFIGVRELNFTQPEWSVVVLSSVKMVVEPDIEWAPVRVFDAEEDIVRFRCRQVLFVNGTG